VDGAYVEVVLVVSVSLSHFLFFYPTRESLAGGLVQYRDEDGSCRARYALLLCAPLCSCLCGMSANTTCSSTCLLARLRLSAFMKCVGQREVYTQR